MDKRKRDPTAIDTAEAENELRSMACDPPDPGRRTCSLGLGLTKYIPIRFGMACCLVYTAQRESSVIETNADA